MSDDIKTDELTELKKRADKLGISYHPNISLDKLKIKVNTLLAEDQPEEKEEPAEKLTKQQKRIQAIKEQTSLVRVRVTNMNAAKKEHQGVLLTASNSVVGTVRKFIPFDVPWHIPRILFNVLKEKQHAVFYTEKVNGNEVTKTRRTNSYAVEELPALTDKEIKELAQRQAMAAGTGE